MGDLLNRAFRLRRRPTGRVTEQDLELVQEPVPDLADGQALVHTRYLSLDPTNRIWMSEQPSYIEPVALNAVMRGVGVGEVIESRRDDLKAGDLVSGFTGWQEYVLVGEGLNEGRFTTLPDPLPAPLPAFLGVLGHTGITAWLGLKNIGRIRPGETVFVSAAAGAVGSVAGQLAKQWDAGRVVGCAGGERKCRHVVEELGFDDCVDYKRDDWRRRIDEATPDGIDVNFENVGGEIMDHVLGRLNVGGRVPLCGMISQYNADASWRGQAGVGELIMKRATMTGFVVLDHADQFAEAIGDLAGLWSRGTLRADETVVDGLPQARDALNDLFDGGNVGKLLIKVSDPRSAP